MSPRSPGNRRETCPSDTPSPFFYLASSRRYAGYQNITLLPAGSTPTKSASVLFSSLQQAESVQKALDGFKLKPDWAMGVVVVPADALA